jgi:hypothetical protein
MFVLSQKPVGNIKNRNVRGTFVGHVVLHQLLTFFFVLQEDCRKNGEFGEGKTVFPDIFKGFRPQPYHKRLENQPRD